jgi:cellulose biosynthesis protein BcsQ
MAKRLVLFNHKGGVSKTTSSYNIGWMIAKEHRVLLVDADPQCNLTSLILGDDFEQYYFDDSTRMQNIKDGVAPAFDARPVPIATMTCFSPPRAPNVHLLAGHADLSAYDGALTLAQMSNNAIPTLQNLPGAFAQLLALTEARYGIDYTVIDLNPSLSSINQNLFLVSDAFIIPTNPDPFSIMALNTLKGILPRWATWKQGAVPLYADSAYPIPPGTPKFIGTLIQRFNIRRGKAARPYRDNIIEIKERVTDTLYPALSSASMTLEPENYGSLPDDGYCLGEIADFQSLLPKSHEAGVPIFELADSEIGETGPVQEGFQVRRDRFHGQFVDIAGRVLQAMVHA